MPGATNCGLRCRGADVSPSGRPGRHTSIISGRREAAGASRFSLSYSSFGRSLAQSFSSDSFVAAAVATGSAATASAATVPQQRARRDDFGSRRLGFRRKPRPPLQGRSGFVRHGLGRFVFGVFSVFGLRHLAVTITSSCAAAVSADAASSTDAATASAGFPGSGGFSASAVSAASPCGSPSERRIEAKSSPERR